MRIREDGLYICKVRNCTGDYKVLLYCRFGNWWYLHIPFDRNDPHPYKIAWYPFDDRRFVVIDIHKITTDESKLEFNKMKFDYIPE